MVKINFKLSKYFWDKNPRHNSMWEGVFGSGFCDVTTTTIQSGVDRRHVCMWLGFPWCCNGYSVKTYLYRL